MQRKLQTLCLLAASTLFLMGITWSHEKGDEVTAAKEVFKIDPVHSTALFRAHHMKAGAFYGRFNEIEGVITLNPEGKADLQVEITIPIMSVDTNSDRLNRHLKSSDFFDVNEYEHMTFKSTSAKKIKKKKNLYKVTGDLTIHGVTKPITIQVEQTGLTDGRRGRVCGFEAIFTVRRSEYGMTYGLDSGAIGDEIKIILAVEAGVPREVGRRGRGGRGDSSRGEAERKQRLAAMDVDGDGKVQRSEVPERMRGFFDFYDKNKDGILDADELGTEKSGGDSKEQQKP